MISHFILAQAAADNAAATFLGLGILGLVLAIIATLFWLAMLIHALTNAALSATERIVWALIIFFLPVIGGLVYLFVGRKAGVKIG